MRSPSDHSFLRKILLDMFPWFAGFALDDKRDLSVRSATGRVHLAGENGVTDPAVHRVGDLGDGGTFTSPIPGQLTWTGADGSAWSITLQSAAPGSPVAIALVHATGATGKIVTKAETGSKRTTSG